MITLIDALISGWPNNEWSISGTNEQYSSLVWKSTVTTKPTESEIQAKIAELEAAEPLRLLRQQRNQLLAKSDWMAVSDRVMTQAQIDYRQSLRDLPATADPQLDGQGNLTNVTWPSL